MNGEKVKTIEKVTSNGVLKFSTHCAHTEKYTLVVAWQDTKVSMQ